MKQTFVVNDFVKVNRDRGLYPMGQVTAVNPAAGTATVKFVSGNEPTEAWYTCHLYKDMDTIKHTRQWVVQRAAKIGWDKRKK